MQRPVMLAAGLTLLAGLSALVLGTVLWIPEVFAADPASDPALDPTVWKTGLLAAAAATGASSLGAAYAVARVGSAVIGALVEKPELFGRLLILVGLAEGIAIYGLIVSVLILQRLT